MRVLTYNIHGCVGVDGREDADRILRVINSAQADVIALQEVDKRDASDRSVIEALRKRGLQVIYGPTLERGGGEYGNLLASRLPVTSYQLIDLSIPGREPRGAISAVVEFQGERISVVATHLGLGMEERRRQVGRLIANYACHEEQTQPDVRVLLGDFNEWFVPGRPLRRLRGYFGGARALRTFPAAFPLFKLDRVWVSPRKRLKTIHTLKTPEARRASDHLPVVADIHPGSRYLAEEGAPSAFKSRPS